MEKFVIHDGLVAPLDRSNIDTDAIIPKQFLTSIKRTGFGQFLFDEWRYLDRGELGMECAKRPINPDFSLNQPQHVGASILLTRTNFGCGSSREHAAWALAEYGFRVVIAPSFADIYYQNSLKNGILSLALTEEQVDELFELAGVSPLRLRVDLIAQTVSTLDGCRSYAFEIDPFRKHCLLEGLDDIGLTLAKADEIRAFEKEHWVEYPWLTESLI